MNQKIITYTAIWIMEDMNDEVLAFRGINYRPYLPISMRHEHQETSVFT